MFLTKREFHAGSDSGNGEGSLESQSGLAPHVQHQQYLGERRPELDQFPYPEWEGQRLPGQYYFPDWALFHLLILFLIFVLSMCRRYFT